MAFRVALRRSGMKLLTSGVLLCTKAVDIKDTLKVHIADDCIVPLWFHVTRGKEGKIALCNAQEGTKCVYVELKKKETIAANADPIPFYEYNGKKAYVNCLVECLGTNDDMEKITYTIFMEE